MLLSEEVGTEGEENLTASRVDASGERKVVFGLRRDIDELVGGGIKDV